MISRDTITYLNVCVLNDFERGCVRINEYVRGLKKLVLTTFPSARIASWSDGRMKLFTVLIFCRPIGFRWRNYIMFQHGRCGGGGGSGLTAAWWRVIKLLSVEFLCSVSLIYPPPPPLFSRWASCDVTDCYAMSTYFSGWHWACVLIRPVITWSCSRIHVHPHQLTRNWHRMPRKETLLYGCKCVQIHYAIPVYQSRMCQISSNIVLLGL